VGIPEVWSTEGIALLRWSLLDWREPPLKSGPGVLRWWFALLSHNTVTTSPSARPCSPTIFARLKYLNAVRFTLTIHPPIVDRPAGILNSFPFFRPWVTLKRSRATLGELLAKFQPIPICRCPFRVSLKFVFMFPKRTLHFTWFNNLPRGRGKDPANLYRMDLDRYMLTMLHTIYDTIS